MFPYEIYQFYESATVADPDLQIRGGGGGVSKKFFSALHGLIWSKNKGGPGPPGPPGPLPWIRHCGFY